MKTKSYELKPVSGAVKINLGDGEYLVSREESETGVITVTCMPSEQISKELDSKLGSINSEITILTIQVDEANARITALNKEKKNIEDLK